MRREDLEKLNNAEWKAAYEAGIARADAVGATEADAYTYAAIAADIAVVDAKEAKQREAAALTAARARLAHPPQEPANAEPATDASAEAWRKAVARINAGRGDAEPDSPRGDGTPASDAGGQEQAVPRTEAEEAWARTVERVNEGR